MLNFINYLQTVPKCKLLPTNFQPICLFGHGRRQSWACEMSSQAQWKKPKFHAAPIWAFSIGLCLWVNDSPRVVCFGPDLLQTFDLIRPMNKK